MRKSSMSKTKIEWVRGPGGSAGYSWNPVKGKCPIGCWYCYARRFYDRFKWGDFIRVDYIEMDIRMPRQPAGIFVCSTMEIFAMEVKPLWRDHIFHRIAIYPQHRFFILTKLPGQIDRPMPPNVWLGTTITGDDNQWRRGFELFHNAMPATKKFISFEPLFKPVEILDELGNFDWIIVGQLTGYGKKYQPHKSWIHDIVDVCGKKNVPVFLKDNLRPIWGEPLIQEMPDESNIA